MVYNSSQTTSGSKEYWLKNNWIPNPSLRVSTISDSQDALWQDPELEAPDKLRAIIEQRIHSTRHTLVSAVVDKPDFLPLSFLQTGTKRSLAVCRIVRNFSLQGFQELVKEIQKFKDTSNFDSPEELKEIFSIPDCVADEIFQSKSPSKKDGLNLLEVLSTISEEQLAKVNPIPIGTGFLVGGTHLLTNQHVLPTQEVAEQCIAQFNYVDEFIGARSIDYEFDPKVLFVSNPDLDYTLVQLKAGMFTMPAGYKFGWIQLIEDEENIVFELDKNKIERLNINAGFKKDKFDFYEFTEKKILPGDAVIIIQHPKGRRKEITLNNNTVKSLYKDFLRYTADSDYGSSGSPVFNSKWELVALHHAAIAEVPEKSEQENKQDSYRLKIVAQQGVRICRIVEDLKKKSFSDPALTSFVEYFVVTSEQLNYPPFPSAIEFDGTSSYVDLGNNESLDITGKITFEALIKCNDVNQNGIIVKVGAYSLSYEAQKLQVSKMLQYDGVNPQEEQSYSPYPMNLSFGRGGYNRNLYRFPISSINTCISTIDSVLKDGLWHHVAFTEDDIYLENNEINCIREYIKKSIDKDEKIKKIEEKIKQKVKVYIDGKLLKNDKVQYEFKGGYSDVNRESVKFYIGGVPDNNYFAGNTQNSFSGSITEVRLWTAVRTHEEIIENMYRISLKSEEKAEGLTLHPQFGVRFNGWSDYIDCGNYDSLKIENAITVEAWVQDNPSAGNGMIVNRGGIWHEKGFCIWKCDGMIRAELSDGVTQALVDATLDSRIKDSSWYHVAFTWNTESKRIKVYINGEEQSPKQKILLKGESIDPKEDELFEGSISEPEVNLNIGRGQRIKNNPGIEDKNKNYFDGCIADVRLWKVARTQYEIKANMFRRLKGNENGLIGYWRLDEEEGNKAKNLASEGDDGIVYGGKWLKPYHLLVNNQSVYGLAFGTKWLRASQYPAFPLPFGLQFQEESDHIDCGSGENLNTSTAITVEAWVKHKFGNGLIVGRGGQKENGYSLSWYEGKIRVTLQGANPDEKTVIDTKDNAPSDCVWHHITFTWDKKSKEIAIYIDGRLQNSVVIEGKSKSIVFQGQYKSIGLFEGSISHLTANLIIGAREKEESYFNVAISDVRLWKVARTQDQIKANMSLRLKGDEEGLIGYWRLDDGGEGNKQVRDLAPGKNHGTVHGATWFPAPPRLETSPSEDLKP